VECRNTVQTYDVAVQSLHVAEYSLSQMGSMVVPQEEAGKPAGKKSKVTGEAPAKEPNQKEVAEESEESEGSDDESSAEEDSEEDEGSSEEELDDEVLSPVALLMLMLLGGAFWLKELTRLSMLFAPSNRNPLSEVVSSVLLP
jgi:hypothetical protein